MMVDSGAKAPSLRRLYAALKDRSSTGGVLPQGLKPVMIEPETAGLKACSTPAKTLKIWKQVAFAPDGVC